MSIQDENIRRDIGAALDALFPSIFLHIAHLKPPLQASVLYDIASLGSAFEQHEWRQFSPPVPVYLLDGLLGYILLDLPVLAGPQIARLLQSLTKLCLTDVVTYTQIADHVIQRIRNSDPTFMALHVLSTLARTFGANLQEEVCLRFV